MPVTVALALTVLPPRLREFAILPHRLALPLRVRMWDSTPSSRAGWESPTRRSPRSRAAPRRLDGLRVCQKINVSTSGSETVVPVAMKLVSPELKFGHLLVGNL